MSLLSRHTTLLTEEFKASEIPAYPLPHPASNILPENSMPVISVKVSKTRSLGLDSKLEGAKENSFVYFLL